MQNELILKLDNIKKFYGHLCALDGFDISIQQGSVYGFVGPNGAGKTTALKIMAGLTLPDEGTVSITGLLAEHNPALFKTVIGYVPESFGVYSGMIVSEYMEFFASCYGLDGYEARKKADDLIKYVELIDRADFYVDALSTGMKQKLSLARALINDPLLLIMDEPTSGLDPRARLEFKQIVEELVEGGKTVLMSSHVLSDIYELCTDIGIIDQGSMVMSGRITDVMRVVSEKNPLVISLFKNTTQAIRFLKNDTRVKSLSIHGNDLLVGFNGTYEEEAKFLKDMIDAGLPVRNFSRKESTLENLFMQITGHSREETVQSYEPDAGSEDKA